MASKIKVDQIQTADGSGTIALQNQLSGMTTASLPALGSAQMPTGSVLQVVQTANETTTTISTTGSWQAVGLEASITPSSTSSKILITVTGSQYTDSNDQTAGATIFRGSTNLGHANQGFMPTYVNWGNGGGDDLQITCSAAYLDSPSTTSATTYSVKAYTDKNNYKWNGLRPSKATIVLTEIKG